MFLRHAVSQGASTKSSSMIVECNQKIIEREGSPWIASMAVLKDLFSKRLYAFLGELLFAT